jgi:hypothetical protein
LGQGSTQWAAVAGFENGSLLEEDGMQTGLSKPQKHSRSISQSSRHSDSSFDDILSHGEHVPSSTPASRRLNQSLHCSTELDDIDKVCSPEKTPPLSNRRSRQDMPDFSFEALPKAVETSFSFQQPQSSVELVDSVRNAKQQAGIFVRKGHGGGIYVDDPGFLALWSVQTIALVRRHLYRAGNGMILIPCQSNWINVDAEEAGEVIIEAAIDQELPHWAGKTDHENISSGATTLDTNEARFHRGHKQTHVTITDLPMMVGEVQELLDTMQDVMDIQRRRRLEKLRPPNWFRYNWYIIAAMFPPAVFLTRNFNVRMLLSRCMEGIKSFYRERLQEPLMAM